MEKAKKFFIKNYSSSLDYVKESKNFIYIIMVVFFTFAFLGFFIPTPETLKEQVTELIQGILDKTKGMSGEEITGFIFLNNTKASFLGLILGIFLGIFPLLTTIINGYIVGFVSLMGVQKFGFLSLWKLLPHGIFELTGVFISLGLGLRLGTLIFKKPETERNIWEYKFQVLKDNFIKSLKVFVFIVIPLLILAAIIEGVLITFLR